MFNSTKYCRFSPGKDPSEPYPQILQELPGLYFRQTGNSTRYLFSQIMELLAPITMSSTIHDNACGPGTASSVILDAHPDIHLMIYGTDGVYILKHCIPSYSIVVFKSCGQFLTQSTVNFWMVQEFNTKIKKRNPICVGVINDSEKLYVSDSCFTHSITNFGLSHSTSPLSWAKEIYRTLQPDGQAVITTWKRFGVGDVINVSIQGKRCSCCEHCPESTIVSEELFVNFLTL